MLHPGAVRKIISSAFNLMCRELAGSTRVEVDESGEVVFETPQRYSRNRNPGNLSAEYCSDTGLKPGKVC
jgi:hypothetical protein